MNKELLKQWGENTAYGAKSHFKSSDLKRIWIKTLVVINILFAILSILELPCPILLKILSITSLIASILIIVYESQEDKNTIKKHMRIGDEYLSIHYELQELFHKENISEEEFESVSKKIKRLNAKEKPIVNQLAKKWAKKKIEKKIINELPTETLNAINIEANVDDFNINVEPEKLSSNTELSHTPDFNEAVMNQTLELESAVPKSLESPSLSIEEVNLDSTNDDDRVTFDLPEEDSTFIISDLKESNIDTSNIDTLLGVETLE